MRFPNDDESRLILAVMTWLTVTGVLVALFVGKIPTENRDLIIALSTGLLGAFTATTGFYNKSGIANDRQKDDTINKVTSTIASMQAAQSTANTTVLGPGETAVVTTEPNPNDTGST